MRTIAVFGLMLALLCTDGLQGMQQLREKQIQEIIKQNENLVKAVKAGNPTGVKHALEHGAISTISDEFGYTMLGIALYKALVRNKQGIVIGLNPAFVEIAKLLAQYGADVTEDLNDHLFEFQLDDGTINKSLFATDEVLNSFLSFHNQLRSMSNDKENLPN